MASVTHAAAAPPAAPIWSSGWRARGRPRRWRCAARGERGDRLSTRARRRPALDAAARRLSAAGVEVHLDASGDALAARAGTLIKSPGVPQRRPLVRAARARGIPVLGELELAWRLLENEFVAVTGTNGKTTTTEWIGHIHRGAGRPVAVAGQRRARPLSSLVGELDADATIVCEASSFQLEDTVAFAPEAAVLLNLAPDHLDRHGELRRLRRREAADLRQPGQRRRRGGAGRPRGRGPRAGARAACSFGAAPDAELRRPRGLPVVGRAAADRGRPDRAAGARTTGRTRWRPPPSAWRAESSRARSSPGSTSFAGVAHRLEQIAVAAGRALGQRLEGDERREHDRRAARRSPGGVHLIAGGRGKGQDFTPLAPAGRGRVARPST